MALQAGAAQVNITPPLGVELQGSFNARYAATIHDDLWAKAIVLDDGDRRLALVLLDLIAITPEIASPAKERIAAECGIPPERVLISATHTHTAPVTMHIAACTPPADYVATLPGAVADAVKMATDRLTPAELGFGTGACPEVVFNRRWHLADGTVRMNPGYQHPQLVEPAGPTDPILSVMVLRDLARRPLAVYANLSLHYVGAVGDHVSADYFGYFARALQRCAGAEFVTILSNGCQGDINNCDYRRPGPSRPAPYHHTERVADVVAGEAWRVWNTLWEEDFRRDITVEGALEMRSLAPRRPSEELIAEAKAYLANHKVEDDLTTWTYMREYTIMEHDWPESISLPIQALRIGDIGLVGVPAEPFCEIGLALRERSPFDNLIPVGLANDFGGYVGTQRHYALGGYEMRLCRWAFAPEGTAEDWIETGARLLSTVCR